MFTRSFWRDATERAVRTAAQTLLALLATGGTGMLDIDWPAMLGAAGFATLLSLLTSIAASGTGDPGSAGFVSLRK